MWDRLAIQTRVFGREHRQTTDLILSYLIFSWGSGLRMDKMRDEQRHESICHPSPPRKTRAEDDGDDEGKELLRKNKRRHFSK